MISETKEILLPEKIIEKKNWPGDFSINDLHFNTDNAINRTLIGKGEESYLILKLKKPTKKFRKIYFIIDASCDIVGEEFEITVYKNGCQIFTKTIKTIKQILTRYKIPYEFEEICNENAEFEIKLNLISSKNTNKYLKNYAYTFFSIFLETVVENENYKKEEENTIEYINFSVIKKKDSLKIYNKLMLAVYKKVKCDKILDELRSKNTIERSLKINCIVTKISKNNKEENNINFKVGFVNKKIFDKVKDDLNELKELTIHDFNFPIVEFKKQISVKLEYNKEYIENYLIKEREDTNGVLNEGILYVLFENIPDNINEFMILEIGMSD